MKVAVIIPAYNEQLTIADVVAQFHGELPDAEIWVVNNASTDDTAEEAKRVFAERRISGGVLDESRKGKSNACRKAFREIDADIYVMVDADLTYPAERVHDLIEPVATGKADLVIADRLSNEVPQAATTRRFHSMGNYLVCKLLSLFFGTTIHDAMSGYRVMSREFVIFYPMLQSGFELETEMTIHAVCNGYVVEQIPCQYRDRLEGSVSKLSTYSDGARVLKLIIRLLKNNRPVPFFGGLAIVFAVIGTAVGMPVVVGFFRTGLVLKVPSAILASSLWMISFLMALIGVVMDTMTSFQRIHSEIQRNVYRRTGSRDQSAS